MRHFPIVADADAIAANVAEVRERTALARARGGHGQHVRVVAAVKYVDADVVRALVTAGVTDVGENRVETLVAKQGQLAAGDRSGTVPDAPTALGGALPELTWHYIGRLQSRKAREVAAHADVIHTLCSDSAAQRLAEAARSHADTPVRPQLLVQVNVAHDPAKDGIEPDELDRFLAELPEPLRVEGLMTMPAATHEAGQSRPAFAHLRTLLEAMRDRHGQRHPLRELSMGTTQDYEVAVEEGATLVRLGRVLYGARE